MALSKQDKTRQEMARRYKPPRSKVAKVGVSQVTAITKVPPKIIG